MRLKSTGFTLLEMIAALGVFSVVIVIFSSTFLSLLNAERRAQASAGVQDNLRFALEVMSKEIRTGTDYPAPGTYESITFTNRHDPPQRVTYRLNEFADEQCSQEHPCIGKKVCDASGSNCSGFLPLTSDQISIDRLRFIRSGIQPRIQIVVNGRAKIQNVETKLNVQTTVSQRKVVQSQP